MPKLILDPPGKPRQEFTLGKSVVTIGRLTTCDIVLRDWTVSRRHARIERTNDGFDLVDEGSLHGSWINGVRQRRCRLVPSDQLTVGGSVFRFEISGDGDAATQSRTHSAADPLFDQPLPVQLEETAVARLAVHTEARTWEVSITGDTVKIGRSPENDVVLPFRNVSRTHAVIERHARGVLVRDLGSENGTWIRDERISRQRLKDGDTIAIGPARLVFKGGLSSDDLTVEEREPRAAGPRRPVVVIPGFVGSNLWLGTERVWPTLRVHDIPLALKMAHRLDARGVIDDIVIVPNLIRLDQYGVLTGYLRESLGYEAGRDLLEFAYDFRQDNRLSAQQLAAAIDQWHVSSPITIIAHSMGCLIARYYIERLGGKRRIERAILLGGPHAGTPSAYANLMKGPDLLPLGLLNQRLRDAIATFPASYQILPTDRCVTDGPSVTDVWSNESWLAEEHRPLLRDAREFRAELGSRSSVPTVCIFGYGISTITGAVVQRDSRGQLTKTEFLASDIGDGTIPQSSAILKHAEIHPVRQHHGSLYTDNDVKMRLKIELTR